MDGQQDIENRSFSDAAFYRDGSSTVEQQLLDNGQPQPRTRTFCPTLADAIKAIEDFGNPPRQSRPPGKETTKNAEQKLMTGPTRTQLNSIVKRLMLKFLFFGILPSLGFACQ